MKMIFCIIAAVLALAATEPQDSTEVILKLNQDLLRATENPEIPPNPSIHIALRLSNRHNLLKEGEYLKQLKTKYHNDIQRDLNEGKPVTGRLALYVMALKSSCNDLSIMSLTTGQKSERLLTHLKRQMELEKDNFAIKGRPLTNFYQYSLGILALCVSRVRVSPQVSHQLINATLHNGFVHTNSVDVDTVAMAGMALQCLTDSKIPVGNQQELVQALITIKQDLLKSERADGHLGNEFSTGLAVQALLAMGCDVDKSAASINAMLTDAKKGTYHNPMGISQILPALQWRSYVHLKNKECVDEDDTLTLAPTVLPTLSVGVPVEVKVEVVKADGSSFNYRINVLSGVSLLQTLTLLQQKTDFNFETEHSLWGPFLSVVNGEKARQSDRRYWHTASNGEGLGEGIRDYKIKAPQKITIKNTTY